MIIGKKIEQRTLKENSALHLYFRHLAEALNDGGFSVQLVLKEKMDIDWNEKLVKEILWRTAQKAILGKESTTQLKKQMDIDKIYDHLNRHLSEKFGVYVAFPSIENQLEKLN